MTHLPSFVPFRVLVRVYWQSRFKFLLVPSKNHFRFFFASSAGPYYMMRIFIPLLWSLITHLIIIWLTPNLVQLFIYSSSIIILSYMTKHISITVVQHCVNSWYSNTSCIQIKSQKFFKFLVCLSILMYFIGAKFLSNDLKGTGDIVIFVLLCKIIHSFMHANMQIIIMHSVA